MVYAFFIQSVLDQTFESDANASPTILFSIFYKQPDASPDLKSKRCEVVAIEVQKQSKFLWESANAIPQDKTLSSIPDFSQHSLQGPLEPFRGSQKNIIDGAFQIGDELHPTQPPDLFDGSKSVLWKQVQTVAYVLICDEGENRLLAAHFIQLFIKAIDDQFKKPSASAYPREFLVRAEEFLVLLHTFLPNGQLLFISPPLIKHLRKEAESLLLSKP
eukprot:TRINITY_DN10538_c0_g1_i1.p1 TRINITY_DN10538_c0_g1~~TRINITY_DN10538_c0_g1_i1.p1  ORF type:complete len:217 (+),score=28.77 TRINITY_DN10538_c0_g1_i1:1-651(+)